MTYFKEKRTKKILSSRGDSVFYTVNNTILISLLIIVGYPLIYILSSSFSSVEAVNSGKVFLWPVDFSLQGYKAVFTFSDIWVGYRNSVFYTVFGTFINVCCTVMAAYPLSRRNLPGRNLFMFLFSFTMIFSGGMIPAYLLVNNLGMMNTVWAILIPGAISVNNMIITRTFFQSNIPGELLEAAQMDGCSDIRFFLTIVLPLSKAVIAVISMYYAIFHWNAYFNAFIYLTDKKLYPLQIILRDILISSQIDPSILAESGDTELKDGLANLLKYSLIVVATIPVMIIYPFVQKYFVKGIMIGSIKG